MPRCPLRPALALLAGLCALAACAAPPPLASRQLAVACRPVRRVELPLREARNFLLAAAALDGKPATLLVDTGAQTSTLTPRAVLALHLRRDQVHGRMLAGITGNVRSDTVRLRRLAMNGVLVAGGYDIAIGTLPSLDGLDPPVAGLLGADVLARFEVDLDLPSARMALYSRSPCADYLPWPGAAPVPFRQPRPGLVVLDAEVDGAPVRALLDTGARTSLLTRAAARALGVTEPMLASDPARTGSGVGSASVAMRRHRFASFGLHGEIERDMAVDVADLTLPGVDMLLGADFLGRRQVWISYATGRLFVR